MTRNVEKLKKLRTRVLLIFWVGIPALLAVVYFAFFHGAAPPEPTSNGQVPTATPAPANPGAPTP